MGVYILEYDMDIILRDSTKTEHRQESHLDIAEFISRVKYIKEQWYMHNLKTYIGKVEEIDVNKVINPWE